MDLSLFFAGTGGSVPGPRRGLPAILVRRGAERMLFDCGEGTQRQLVRSVGLADLDSVFITHFHADHWLGLPGMLKSFGLRERAQPLSVYGPPGLNDLMAQARFMYGRLPYELAVIELQAAEVVERDGFRVAAVPVRHHRGQAFGYAIVEDARPGHLDPQLAERLGVTPGPDFGRLQRGETVGGVSPEQVMGPTREGRKLVISGDTAAPCEALQVAAHEADVLVHEATFTEQDAERARETGHSTARGAAQLARDAHVRMLALVHLSTRHTAADCKAEARAVFPQAEVPRDFDTIEVPFPERGSAQLVRWSERVRAGAAEVAGAEAKAGAGAESGAPGEAPTTEDTSRETHSAEEPSAEPVAPH